MPKPSAVTWNAERLRVENRRLAKILHQLQIAYALYGLFDGASTSYSTLAYFLSLADCSTSSADSMHEWMGSSSGIAIAATETITLVTFSLLANIFDDKDKNAFKKYTAIVWPYCRDSIKGLKNAYKGVRSNLQAISFLSGQDLQNMIVPLGLALGLISILNRILMRRMKDERVGMTKDNTTLLSEIQSTPFHILLAFPPAEAGLQYKNSYILVGQELKYVDSNGIIEDVPITDPILFIENIRRINPDCPNYPLGAKTLKLYLPYKDIKKLVRDNGGFAPSTIGGFNKQECEERRGAIQCQADQHNNWALLGATCSGLVDGPYLYMGALGLTVMSPPVFMAMAICSAVFSIMCVTTRVYEEYEFQRKLKITQAKVEVALCCREFEGLLGALQTVYSRPSNEGLARLCVELQQSDDPVIVVQARDLAEELGRLPAEFDAQKVNFRDRLKTLCIKALVAKEKELENRRKDVHSLTSSPVVLAIVAGLRNGLAIYGAITSLMFAVATINAILLVSFPPAFLIAGVVTGMVCLVAFAIYALVSHVKKAPAPEVDAECSELFKVLQSLKGTLEHPIPVPPQDLKHSQVSEAVLEAMDVPPPSQIDVSDGCEVVRSFGSGFAKGPKLLGFLRSMWLVVSLHEGDSDTPIWLKIGAVCAVVQALIFTFRAWARGFGRDAPDVIKLPEWKIELPPAPQLEQPPEPPQNDNDGLPPPAPGASGNIGGPAPPAGDKREEILGDDDALPFNPPRAGARSPLMSNTMFRGLPSHPPLPAAEIVFTL